MKHFIDLHGMKHNEALEKTEDALLKASLQQGMVFEIITGNSIILQQKVIKEILGKHKFSYYIPSENLGMIIVSDNTIY